MSITIKRICDECGAHMDQPGGWTITRITAVGNLAITINDPPRDFCSLDCLRVWIPR